MMDRIRFPKDRNFLPTRPSLPDPWPRRLLHVPSMTSHEWKPGNFYGKAKEPSYNAISYTWGRFEVKNGPAIKINGVTWKIPSIDPSHFSVAEFETAIARATDKKGYLWLDVACIDQENNDVKLEEVNKQVAIFRRAAQVYAWITPWDTQSMVRTLQVLETYTTSSLGAKHGGYKLKPLTSSTAPINLPSLQNALADLAAQGWFTSLWTLQEAWLREPWLMSRSADVISAALIFQSRVSDIERPVSLAWIVGDCWDVWRALQSDRSPVARLICGHILDSGMLSLYCRNKSVLYRAATRRKARQPEDAVYGIMQVYDIRMPTRTDINRLFVDFGLVLNTQDLLSAQLFLHEKPVPLPGAWRMSRNIHVPLIHLLPYRSRLGGTLVDSDRPPQFDGSAIFLSELVSFWEVTQRQRRGAQVVPYIPHVYLDATQSNLVCMQLNDEVTQPDPAGYNRCEDNYTQRVQLAELSRHMPYSLEKYQVLYLGSIHTDLSDFMTHQKQTWELTFHIGLLVRQEKQGGGEPWYRVGFCSWLAVSEGVMREEQTIRQKPDKIPMPPALSRKFGCRIG
ncbi:hypothetical protein DL768_010964 [Monosporascus sp. mg162]|nr:hypothetical protein DL768_010964 [Monosporascus sp. mg162]